MNELKTNTISNDTDAVAQKLAMLSNRTERREYLSSIGDSYFGISWKDFIELAKSYGFELGYHQYFMGYGLSDEKNITEEEVIMYHRDKGLILHADSRCTSVNTAKVYGEVKISKNGLTSQQIKAMYGSMYSCSDDYNMDSMSFSVDVREGFRYHLDTISEAYKFSKSWSRTQFLWFLNYTDYHIPNYSFEQINSEKLEACTPEVRRIIFGN